MKKVFEAFNFSKEDIDRWNSVPPGDDLLNSEGVSLPFSNSELDLRLMSACGARSIDRLGEIKGLINLGADIHCHKGKPFQLAVGTHNSAIWRALLSDEKLMLAGNVRPPLLSDEIVGIAERLQECKDVISYLLSCGARFSVTYDEGLRRFGVATYKRIRLYRLRKWLGLIK